MPDIQKINFFYPFLLLNLIIRALKEEILCYTWVSLRLCDGTKFTKPISALRINNP